MAPAEEAKTLRSPLTTPLNPNHQEEGSFGCLKTARNRKATLNHSKPSPLLKMSVRKANKEIRHLKNLGDRTRESRREPLITEDKVIKKVGLITEVEAEAIKI